MSSRRIQDLHPELKPLCMKFLQRCTDINVRAFITTTYRSNQEQGALYAQGRSKSGPIVTHADAGQSKHNFMINGSPAAKAFDFAIYNDDNSVNWDAESEPWQKAIQVGRDLGLECGADWNPPKRDCPHMQLREGPNANSLNTQAPLRPLG